MTRCLLARALALVLAVALTACGGDDGDTATDTTTRSTEADRTTTPADEDDPIELLDPGQEPREEMRLDLSPGATQALRMAMDIDMELTIGGQTQTIDSPRTLMDFDTEVVDAADGVFTLRSTLSGADVEAGTGDPSVIEQTRQLLQTMVGTTYRQQIDARGAFQGGDAPEIPAGVPAEARSMIEQASTQLTDLGVAFPEDPVGVGARWSRRTEATLNGMTFEIVYEYVLTERTGDDYVVDVTYEQQVVTGRVDVPGGGGTVVADGGTITGEGQVRGTLTSILGTSTVRGMGEIAMHVEEGGNRTDLRQTMTVATEMTRRD